MESIPFKQTEMVGTQQWLLVLLVILLIAVGAALLVRYLKQQGHGLTKTQGVGPIEIIAHKVVSKSTVVYLLEVEGKQMVLSESAKQVQLTRLDNIRKEPTDEVV